MTNQPDYARDALEAVWSDGHATEARWLGEVNGAAVVAVRVQGGDGSEVVGIVHQGSDSISWLGELGGINPPKIRRKPTTHYIGIRMLDGEKRWRNTTAAFLKKEDAVRGIQGWIRDGIEARVVEVEL